MKPFFLFLTLLGTALAQPALAQPTPTGALTLELLSSYRTGQFDESAAEIVAHDPRSQRLFIVNAQRGALDVLDILDPSAPVARDPITLGGEGEVANSVAVHGGVVAVATPRPLGMLDFVRPPRFPLLLILDSVGNPHNLGAIARSAAFFGVGALVLHETPLQAMPTDSAYRVAEGGLEMLDVYRTRNLRKALQALDPHYRTVAATLTPDAAPLQTLPRDRPVALVLGNEERGVSFDALQGCRRQVRILGHGERRGGMQSLNVAQSAAVLLHALTDPVAPKPEA